MSKSGIYLIFKNFNFRLISYTVILLGIAIRLYHYFLDRSFWLDEAMLSNNIITKDWLELLQPLENRQIAPIGFILVQKTMTSIFGNNELALRFFPLLTGIFSIIVFYLLLKKLAGEEFAAAGVLIFILGKYLIFHSTEAKQYGMDVFAFLVAFNYLYFISHDWRNTRDNVIRGITGAILIWFSHCSIFILAGIAFAMGVEITVKKKYDDFRGYLMTGSIWLLSFAINYFLFLNNHASQSIQEEAFISEGFLPPGGSIDQYMRWLLPILKLAMVYPLAVNISFLFVGALFSAGLLYIFIYKDFRLLTLVIPIFIHIVLSVLLLYPFGGRFNLYMASVVVFFIVLGLKLVSCRIKYAGAPFALLLLLGLITYPARRVLKPFEFEEIKPALSYIQQHQNPGDRIYTHYASIPALDFYKNLLPVTQNIIRGTSGFENDIDSLANDGRVWLLMTHFNEEEKKVILESCERHGKRIDEFSYGGGYTVLFNFNQ